MTFKYIKNTEGLFVCHHCQFTAKNQSTMHYHLAGHDNVLPHKCKHCDQRFPQKSVLDIHLKLKHAETLDKNETYKCPCNGCNYEDIRKGNRLIHFIRVHLKDVVGKLKVKAKNQDDKYVCACSACDKSFKSSTMFFYHAHTCVNLPTTHTYYNDWMTIQAPPQQQLKQEQTA